MMKTFVLAMLMIILCMILETALIELLYNYKIQLRDFLSGFQITKRKLTQNSVISIQVLTRLTKFSLIILQLKSSSYEKLLRVKIDSEL